MRLRPVVSDRPKVLAPVKGKPFLAFLLAQLDRAGFRDVVMCVGYLGNQIQAEFGVKFGRMRLYYSVENEPMGTGGAIRIALPFLKSDPVIVINGDSYCHVNFRDLLKYHLMQKAEATLTLVKVAQVNRFGKVSFDVAGAVTEFHEKGERGSGWINGGVYALSKSALQLIPQGENISLETQLFPELVSRGLFGYRCHAPFLDIGTPKAFAIADKFFDSFLKG